MTFNNYNYQYATKSHKRLQKLAIGDQVMIRVHPERFPLGTLKRLHTRRSGPYKVLKRFSFSAYEVDITCDLGINPLFNVEDLTCFHTLVTHVVQPYPARLHSHRRHSPVVNFSKPGRIDGNH